MLVILGGLPGSGKTTIARELAKRLGAVYLRIDTIEQAMFLWLDLPEDIGPAGYIIAYKVAIDNLRIRNIVIADSVNPIEITRKDWRDVATQAGTKYLEVEITCSDKTQHRHRVESREADIPGHKLPTWQAVVDRDYEPWSSANLILDSSALSVDESVDKIITLIKQQLP